MESDDGEDIEYAEVSVPTELVKRIINSISVVMCEWEKEASEKGAEFNALIGSAAIYVAVKFIESSMGEIEGETLQ